MVSVTKKRRIVLAPTGKKHDTGIETTFGYSAVGSQGGIGVN
jgi:hypothetical protein